MAPLPSETPPVTLVTEYGTAAGDSHQSPSLSGVPAATTSADSQKLASLPEVTAGNIVADYYPPQSLSGETVTPSKLVWPSEADRHSGYQTAVPTSGYGPNGPSLGTRHADGTTDEAAQSETGGFVAIGIVGGAGLVFGAVAGGAYVIHRCRSRTGSSSAESQPDVTRASTASRVKEALTGLCPTNRPKSTLPTESGSRQHPQPIELGVLEQPQTGDYEQLDDSPPVPK